MWLVYSLISSAAWAISNIIDSILVNKYEKHPATLMWFNGFLRLWIVALRTSLLV